MSFITEHLLTAIVFLPLLGALISLAFPRGEATGVRGFALFVTLTDFALALWAWARFDPAISGMQLQERLAWIPSLGITYSLGMDGLSVLLVVLTAFLAPLVVLSTYSSVQERAREYMVCLLFLQAGMLGAFVAIDLLLFYVFWEVMLIPMYFLIGVWGGRRRVYAALKFFLYTMAGSLLMLVAIVYTAWAVKDAGGLTFEWAEIARRLAERPLGSEEVWLFLAFALAFAIKVPMFPFHTWLPDAHVEAPTGGSVILAGVLLKLGTYGFLRFALWLFPKAGLVFLPAIGLLAVIGIIYGALVAMVQTDLKRLVAYSSVSHLGFVMLGIVAMTVTGLSGAVLQMVNHGISTGALFLLVGVIYERRHTREMEDFGGLAKVMPVYATIFVLIALSSVGLPGLNGFVGEFLILLGTFKSEGIGSRLYVADVAQAGMLAAQAVAAISVTVLAFKLAKLRADERIGRPTQGVTVLAAVAAGVVLVGPPLGGWAGGWLIRPLVAPMGSAGRFEEVMATFAVIGTSGVIFAAVYLLLATQKVFFGPLKHEENRRLRDLSGRERLVLLPLCLIAILMGVYPQPFLRSVNATVTTYAQSFRERAAIRPVGGLQATQPSSRAVPTAATAAGSASRSAGPLVREIQKAMPWRKALRRIQDTVRERAPQP